nr:MULTISPECIES: tripartite tricarboxylate transporter substrate binding protein [unclassified Variovorax]
MLSPGAHADPFPAKPVRVVVPFAPGGGTDLIARVLGEGMAQDLKEPVIVDNKPGGGTILGTDVVAKSTPDGYTLLMATFAHAVNPSLHAKLPYDTVHAFTPVALIGRSPNVLVVRPDRGFKSVKELVDFARAHPGKLTYGSYGSGTSAHLAGELLKSLAKVDLTHVPYRGSSPALTDLLGGQIDMMITTVASVATYIQSGKLVPLAVTSATRSPAFPKVPTMQEAGVPGYLAESWYGLYAPAGTPPAVVARLNEAARHAATREQFAKRVQSEGLVLNTGAPDELDHYVTAEMQRWSDIVKTAHITAE